MRCLRCFKYIAAFAVLAFFAGCAEPLVFSEVFQLREGEKIYTRYNLWYTDPMNISSLNIQQGDMIPVGTEIEPVSTSYWDNKITFKDKSGKTYAINFDQGYRICTMRDFVTATFTTVPPDKLFSGIPAKNLARVKRGEVVPGMNHAQVLLAYGPPPAIRTPNPKNETWIYWISPSETVRLIFRGDVVRQIININE